MRANGFYQFMNKDGELKACRAEFESTGIKEDDGHVIWRRIKNGKPTNTFAVQNRPNMPWAIGRWFLKMNGGVVIEEHPELKVETDKSRTMTDSEYIELLKSQYYC